ncbi:uncharacterized protein SCHCODRAFT_02734353 [Schizophyllum commune H4-8]|nr:uncharacterized protein SCHCODRAFT_02734353 [Schizophyllum commune H4-8]KAI5890884.1 hypothetical protein SCHCODRAFT_02734353 [Schizophyllum commune H4-8]
MSASGPQQGATSTSPPASQPPAAFAYNYDNSLEQPAEFRPFSFVFNTVERLMICQLCDCVVQDISGHLNKQHKPDGRLAAVDRAQINVLRKKLKELGGAENARVIKPSLVARPIIAGLRVEWAFTCSHCTLARSERRHAASHVRDKICHPAASLSDRVQCQRPYNKELIRVFLPPSTTNPVLLSFHRFEKAQALLREEVPDDARLVSPFLLRTLWYTHTNLIDTAILIAATEFPADDEFPGLAALVRMYFNEAIRLIGSTDHLVRRHINTPEPAKYVSRWAPLAGPMLQHTLCL